jgi:Zn-dependent M28 family amino/carboxypeptidase
VTSYEVEITAPLEELPLTNVVGVISGRRENEIVLLGGHYDGIGILDPVDGDSIANGANDDASGTTAVIELARYFKAREKPERTLVFAAFTAEESGYLGSKYLARQLNPTEIIAMLNLEAMGKVDPQGRNRAHVTGFDRSDFGAIVQRAMEGTPYLFYPDPYEGQFLFGRADNAPFARFGVPAHTIATISMDPRDEDLHRVSDEVETLDLVHMTGLIKAIARGATAIISGEATPTRIDPPLRD